MHVLFSGGRAESGLLKTRLEAQTKEIAQLKQHIKELEEKEQMANENVIFHSYFQFINYCC